MASSCSSLTNTLSAPIVVSAAQTNNLSLRLKKDENFSLISSYFTIKDCASMICSRDLRNRAEPLLWTPLAIRMGLTGLEASKQTIQEIMKLGVLTYLIFRTTKNIEQALNLRNPEPTSFQKWESFIKMLATLPQIRFNQVFSSKFDNTYLFHSLIHPENISVLKLIFTSFSEDQLSFLFNQTTDSGSSFLHIACSYNNGDFITSILDHIPNKYLDNCLNPLTNELSPLLFSIVNESNSSVYEIVKHAGYSRKIGLLLTQKTKRQSFNFIQYLSIFGKTAIVKELLLFALNLEDRLFVLTTNNNRPLFLAATNGRFDIVNTILDLIPLTSTVFLDGFREIFQFIKDSSNPQEALSLLKEIKKCLDDRLPPLEFMDELEKELVPYLISKGPSVLTTYLTSPSYKRSN